MNNEFTAFWMWGKRVLLVALYLNILMMSKPRKKGHQTQIYDYRQKILWHEARRSCSRVLLNASPRRRCRSGAIPSNIHNPDTGRTLSAVLNLCSTPAGTSYVTLNLLKPTGHVMHQQFNIQQLYVLPTLYLCVLYLSENKQRLVPLTA